MKKATKVFIIGFVFLLCATILVLSADTQTVYNPFTGKQDFIRTGNFSGDNLVMDSQNITDVDCIQFISGGQICDSP